MVKADAVVQLHAWKAGEGVILPTTNHVLPSRPGVFRHEHLPKADEGTGEESPASTEVQNPHDEVDASPEEQLTRHRVEWEVEKLHHHAPQEQGVLTRLKETAVSRCKTCTMMHTRLASLWFCIHHTSQQTMDTSVALLDCPNAAGARR